MKFKLICILLAFTFAFHTPAQTIDEQIGNAINNHSWFQLKRLYEKDGDKIQTPILNPLSRFFIAHFFNRPDSVLFYGNILLEKHQTELGEKIAGIIYYMSDDAARLGLFEDAYQILHAFNDAVVRSGQTPVELFDRFKHQYKAIHEAGGFKTEKPCKTIKIPFNWLSGNRKYPVAINIDVLINGKPTNINYDTGSGANLISKELAEELKLHIISKPGINIGGIYVIESNFAIADSVRLGEIVFRNVPFQIIDFSTGNAEADAKLKEIRLNCVLGNQTMIPLDEIQFDFASRNIIIPEHTSEKPDYSPNIYKSEESTFIAELYDYTSSGCNIQALIDTGASYCGLSHKYYIKNRNLFKELIPTDSIRYAGAGGVGYSKIAKTKMRYRIGGKTIESDSVAIAIDGDIQATQYDMLYGLPEMTRFDRMILNFKDMWIKME